MDDPEEMKKFQEKSFSQFLRDTGMASNDMVGSQEDEQEAMKEEIETLKDPLEHKTDHKEDVTSFEISLVNRNNHAMSIDCFVK